MSDFSKGHCQANLKIYTLRIIFKIYPILIVTAIIGSIDTVACVTKYLVDASMAPGLNMFKLA